MFPPKNQIAVDDFKSDSQVAGFCQINIFPSLVQKNMKICMVGVLK